MIEPLGGTLIDLIVSADEAEQLTASTTHEIQLDEYATSDFELLANGGYSPLTGFMTRADYESVLESMTLVDSTPWSLPIVLPVPAELADQLQSAQTAKLVTKSGAVLGVIEIAEVWQRDAKAEATKIFRTDDEKHPGVQVVLAQSDWLVGGRVHAFALPEHSDFASYRLTPAETRAQFKELGWRTIVGFQTRNPIHRAHEYIIKTALESVDGVLIHPLVGATKADDVPSDVRMDCYETLITDYFPSHRVLLSVFPAAMRYAGPREAIFHAILRRNYGCTHFIVGRDHAGVGDYYGTYDAQKIFDSVDLDKLGIVPMKFEHAFFCLKCEGMGSTKTCPHEGADHVFLSGTKVREMLAKGQKPPIEFSRPEVAEKLIKHYKQSD